MVESVRGRGYAVAVNVGRLVEARVMGLRSRADADAYSQELADVMARMPRNVSPVLLADHRPVVIYSQDVADRLAHLFTRMNARLERVAIVAARSNATLVLQLERLVREAAYANRRVCYASSEAEKHLAATLGPAELQRARAFLAEWTPPAVSER